MSKKTALNALVCVACACLALGVGSFVLCQIWVPDEPIDTITINPDWKWGYGDVLEEVVVGCICGEPRDDGRQCDVYVDIVTWTMLSVWSDLSIEQLESVAGVDQAFEGSLFRDPRYGWETILDGICALR